MNPIHEPAASASESASVEALCAVAGFSRQAYYQSRLRIQQRQARQEQALEAVSDLRRILPRLGTRKLYHEHYARFRQLGIGRDALFGLLRRESSKDGDATRRRPTLGTASALPRTCFGIQRRARPTDQLVPTRSS